jgi:hypothetical protein
MNWAKRMKRVLLSVFLVMALPVMASHIVGGEFELLHLSGTRYRLNLILYFDLNDGNPGAKDQFADASIFSKSDNQLIATQRLFLSSESQISYTQPSCSKGEIRTNKLIYSAELTLDPTAYSDPQGYYISWQRCCRNYQIKNIFSEVPGVGSISAGQTFYLEFPAVVKNGKQFIDSTPKLFPPLNDYACKGKPYYVDFAGTDDDGDSLVYSMVTPLNTKTSTALPLASPRPYPEVTWRSGFSLSSITNGKPDLRISKDGLLTGTPGTIGLFVFAVKVEEYRDKVKIGESRRDFQMLVVDCPVAVPPQITGKKLAETDFTYDNTMTLRFGNTVKNEDRCIEVRVADDDSKSSTDGFQENVTIRVVGLNFKSKNLDSILPSIKTTVLKNGSTIDFRICFPQCPFIKGPYQIGIIAFDDACSLPLTDTLKVTVDTEPPFNTDPYFKTPTANITSVLKEGDQASWPVEIVDDQGDEITVARFLPTNAGMSFSISEQKKGLVKGTLSWDAYCDIYDFTKRTDFLVTIQADDNDVCKFNQPVKRIFNLGVLLPPSDTPVIFTDLVKTRTRIINLEKRVNENLNFNVYATELTDQNTMNLKLTNLTSFSPYGIKFTDASGKKEVSSKFNWDLLCPAVDPAKKSNFTFQFIASDNTNKCKFNKADTVDVNVKVLPPINNKPVLTIASLNNLVIKNSSLDVTLGQSIELTLAGTDTDVIPTKDNLQLALTQATGKVEPNGYDFAAATGQGKVNSIFRWTPDCSIFKDGIYSNSYLFKFKLSDDHCYTAKADSTLITINIKDIDNSGREFAPGNVITPNGDGCNDFFAVEGFEDGKCESKIYKGLDIDAQVSLPLDNCTGQFQGVSIYNRWGGEVFKSTDRKFRWYALNEAAGVYYYTLKFSDKEYKGTISVRN